jgi:hypothetical protein
VALCRLSYHRYFSQRPLMSSGKISRQICTVFTVNRDFHAAVPGRSFLERILVCSTSLVSRGLNFF